MKYVNAKHPLVSSIAGVVAMCVSIECASQQQPNQAPVDQSVTPLVRQYVEGETSRFVMTGTNQGREHTLKYIAEAESTVKRDTEGHFFEEFRWTGLKLGDQDIPLDEKSKSFRQRVSLDASVDMSPPDITGINPLLIGPVFDLMTFYVDLHPSLHQGKLMRPGDSVRVPHGEPNSWADGVNVTLGQDCIDFVLTLKQVDEGKATLSIRHVPPKESSISLPAEWMQERVNSEWPNNWVQVQRDTAKASSETVAAVGHETFDVLIEVERPSGRIMLATMDNPVDVVQRRCNHQLQDCGEPLKYRIRRQIELRRKP